MTNLDHLNNLKIVNRDYDIEAGFFWVEFDGGKSLQCCLVTKQDDCDSEPYHTAEIEVGNSGYTEGLCAECNEWGALDDEWSHIEDFLIEQARLKGIQIIA
jgi:hypothetical protein